MRYFIYENDSIVERQVDSLPPEIEELYAFARQKYVIDYDLDDWADDDTDWGSGYDYNNSYRVLREPFIQELVVRDGAVYGFRVHADHVLVPGEKDSARIGYIRKRYGDMQTWGLIEEESPKPADHIFLRVHPSPDSNHEFTPGEFAEGLVEEVVGKTNIEDKRGRFDDRVRLMLKLTPEAIADPRGTLTAFADFMPVLAKVR